MFTRSFEGVDVREMIADRAPVRTVRTYYEITTARRSFFHFRLYLNENSRARSCFYANGICKYVNCANYVFFFFSGARDYIVTKYTQLVPVISFFFPDCKFRVGKCARLEFRTMLIRKIRILANTPCIFVPTEWSISRVWKKSSLLAWFFTLRTMMTFISSDSALFFQYFRLNFSKMCCKFRIREKVSLDGDSGLIFHVKNDSVRHFCLKLVVCLLLSAI